MMRLLLRLTAMLTKSMHGVSLVDANSSTTTGIGVPLRSARHRVPASRRLWRTLSILVVEPGRLSTLH